jgi:hypothetical protein
MALICKTRRSSTIYAATFSDLKVLHRTDFLNIAEDYPDFKQRIQLIAEERTTANRVLWKEASGSGSGGKKPPDPDPVVGEHAESADTDPRIQRRKLLELEAKLRMYDALTAEVKSMKQVLQSVAAQQKWNDGGRSVQPSLPVAAPTVVECELPMSPPDLIATEEEYHVPPSSVPTVEYDSVSVLSHPSHQ